MHLFSGRRKYKINPCIQYSSRFRPVFLNPRVATRQRVVEDLQRVVELLSKNANVCLIDQKIFVFNPKLLTFTKICLFSSV